MSGVLSRERLALGGMLRQAIVAAWHELPRAAGVGAVLAVAAVPLAVVVVLGAHVAVPLAALPAAVAMSWAVKAFAPVADGGRVRFPSPHAIDPLWVALVVIAAALLAFATGPFVVPSVLAVAGLLVVLPLSAAYGAARGARGAAALRGALVIAAVRPSLALSVLAVGVLCVFGVAATAGVLVLFLPAVHAVYTALLVRRTVQIVNGAST